MRATVGVLERHPVLRQQCWQRDLTYYCGQVRRCLWSRHRCARPAAALAALGALGALAAAEHTATATAALAAAERLLPCLPLAAQQLPQRALRHQHHLATLGGLGQPRRRLLRRACLGSVE